MLRRRLAGHDLGFRAGAEAGEVEETVAEFRVWLEIGSHCLVLEVVN